MDLFHSLTREVSASDAGLIGHHKQKESCLLEFPQGPRRARYHDHPVKAPDIVEIFHQCAIPVEKYGRTLRG
jgi:hypothetical protein